MKLSVIGLGYVGCVAASGLAAAGHDVLGIDIDRKRIRALQDGCAPVYEPGLQARITAAVREGNLRFAHRDDVAEPLGAAALIATGTPPSHDGGADLAQVRAAIDWIKAQKPRDLVVVMKSTVPPGAGGRILRDALSDCGIRYAANPEFLRAGRALADWDAPDRIVIGADPGDQASIDIVKRMHNGISAPYLITDIASAEMVKYASNAFLSTRISFINEIAALCDSVGATIDAVSEGLALDKRTGVRIHAGVGYGGSCFPKDVRALDRLARAGGVNTELLRSVISVNNRQRLLPLQALQEHFDGRLAGIRVAVLGLAFKPDTDDVRDAPALSLIRALLEEGASVTAYDPQANLTAARLLPPSVRILDTPEQAATDAQALALMTEWPQIAAADWHLIRPKMRPPRFIFDGRNALNPAQMRALGYEYVGVGRGAP